MQNSNMTNSLSNARSPYLKQHAENPVAWEEWSSEILQLAKAQNKLVLVSIGYSSCHWCHVMEQECFSQQDTADIMNAHFICIKIDREERPDLDRFYMDAALQLNGNGGWPLNCICLPDGRPVFAGTYFPKAKWEELLLQIAAFYRQNPDKTESYAEALSPKQTHLPTQHIPNSEQINQALQNWSQHFDTTLGGYRWAPKFPLPSHWKLFMDAGFMYSIPEFSNHTLHTLLCMRAGGIYDHAGNGFSRYSTDSYWRIPHFEKMLYDNAQLASIYAYAAAYFENPILKDTAHGCCQFLLDEMQSPEGLFYAAIDADTNHEEGAFFTWTFDEIHSISEHLPPNFIQQFHIQPEGNFEHGKNVLYVDVEEAASLIKPETQIALKSLNQIRNKRQKPFQDNKCITAWNALTIDALATCGRVLHEPTYLDAAEKAANWYINQWKSHKRLFRICQLGEEYGEAFCDDYAWLTHALFVLFQHTGNEMYAMYFQQLLDESIRLFYDENNSIFQYTSTPESFVIRPETEDDVIPSSNAALLRCLRMAYYLFGEETYETKYQAVLSSQTGRIMKQPFSHSYWFQSMLFHEKGFTHVIAGNRLSMEVLQKHAVKAAPGILFWEAKSDSGLPFLKNKFILENRLVFYICRHTTCSLPIESEEALLEALQK